MSNTLNKYKAIIKSGKFTEQEIISFRKLLNGYNTPKEVINELYALFNQKGAFNITKEQTAKGIAYIRKQTFKLNGEIRKSSPFGKAEAMVIRNFKRFQFVGLYDHATNLSARTNYLPVYRVIARDGSFFDYIPAMWGEVVSVSGVYREAA